MKFVSPIQATKALKSYVDEADHKYFVHVKCKALYHSLETTMIWQCEEFRTWKLKSSREGFTTHLIHLSSSTKNHYQDKYQEGFRKSCGYHRAPEWHRFQHSTLKICNLIFAYVEEAHFSHVSGISKVLQELNAGRIAWFSRHEAKCWHTLC